MRRKVSGVSPTAEQIAKKLGISNATVSRVLNHGQNVSPQMREAVLGAIREAGGTTPRLLGPRAAKAAAKPEGKLAFTQIINVVRFPIVGIPEKPGQGEGESRRWLSQSEFFAPEARLATSFSRHIIDGIVDELRTFGKRALVQVAPDLRSRQVLDELALEENQGVFLLGTFDQDVLDFLQRSRQPVVTFMTWDNGGMVDYVGIDNYRGVRVAFEHLAGLGHKRIGYVAGELRYSAVFRERLSAFKAMVAGADLQVRPDWIVEGSCDLVPIQAQVEKVLSKPDRPTAMMCCFDGAAVAVKRAAEKLGLSVPKDLSVVGFDDEDIAQLFTPALTTVRVPTTLMGRQAVQLMMLRQQRPIRPGEGCSIRVTPTLVVRDSTGPVSKEGV